MVDLRKIKKLVELLEQSVVREIEIHEGEDSVRISRDSRSADPPPPRPSEPASPGGAQVAAEMETEPDDTVCIRSPVVGTFYDSPGPDSAPYVQVGQRVQSGQVACIVEAMKVMNHITSDVDGTLLEVRANNGDPVQYDQILFVVRVAP